MLLKNALELNTFICYPTSLEILIPGGIDCMVEYMMQSAKYEDESHPRSAAAAIGHVKEVLHLLKNGAHINSSSSDHSTALSSASWGGHLLLVQKLLDNGAQINSTIDLLFGISALVEAVRQNHEAIVELLLRSGASVNFSQRGITPLMIAIDKRNQWSWIYCFGMALMLIPKPMLGQQYGKQS